MGDADQRRSGVVMMYHYVRPDGAAIPAGIRPMLAGEFERQLDWIGERYEIVGPREFLRWMGGDELSAKAPCLLTFDDGTRDHAEVVTPILAGRGISGVFFVLTGPAEEGFMPLTHAIHWLLGQPDEQSWEIFERYARDELKDVAALGDPAEARRIYHYEPPLRARIKYAANMAMPQDATNEIVRRAADAAGISLAELARDWFVSAEQIAQMHQMGMTIGLHGHSHSSLQVLGAAGIAREIAHGSAYLARITGAAPTWWACPFGGTGASEQTLSAMRVAMSSAGLAAAVTTRKAPVARGGGGGGGGGCGGDPLAIPRYDCIDLPPRKDAAPVELGLS
jgi:peptidoglycan/xylan/chitin deacetylase (PgdA/CDA1 family)